jgi:hypothetical protein
MGKGVKAVTNITILANLLSKMFYFKNTSLLPPRKLLLCSQKYDRFKSVILVSTVMNGFSLNNPRIARPRAKILQNHKYHHLAVTSSSCSAYEKAYEKLSYVLHAIYIKYIQLLIIIPLQILQQRNVCPIENNDTVPVIYEHIFPSKSPPRHLAWRGKKLNVYQILIQKVKIISYSGYKGQSIEIFRMVSSGMLRRVARVRADVSEECSASFIR